MNREQYDKLLVLSASELRDFFILYIGLDCFLKDKHIIKMSKPSFLKEMNYNTKQDRILWEPYSFRLKIFDINSTYYLLFRNKDKKISEFIEPGNIKFKELSNYEDSLPNEVIDLLIDACHNNVKGEEGYKNIQALFNLKKTNDFGYRFIVGSGINYGYNMPQWSELENQFKTVVDGIFKKNICDAINKSVFNTNYGSFQIVKDISYSNYKSILESMINLSKDPTPYDNTTLTAIAAVLYAQSLNHPNETQRVLTFNYDDLLERSLLNCYNEEALTIYKYSIAKAAQPGFSYSVIHSHGFIPKYPEPVLGQNYDSIVLTTNEYFENYKNPSSYGYSQLYEHLNKICCFIGNGLTDYEEQKVVSKHFNDYPSSFHFYYNSIEGLPIEAIMYKTIFLLKIGVIPLWYSSHDEYKNEFYSFAKVLGVD